MDAILNKSNLKVHECLILYPQWETAKQKKRWQIIQDLIDSSTLESL